jgi:hypothetical protein
MPKFIDIAGRKYGRWTVEALDRMTGHGARWHCVCECGARRSVLAGGLRSGCSTSCGCLVREVNGKRLAKLNFKHGLAATDGTRHPLFGLWKRMRQRCTDRNCDDYRDYGAKGVSVCDRWFASFPAFISDMGPRPSPQHSLDRFPDPAGNYEPSNVRWATATEQARNKRPVSRR